ncbi:L,D-transpeptidase [Microlunatus elymi]|uniref:L,D-transpeptidase n=1 Tax=Microlunatus elymi TaxID=2596828 RepID=UPI00143CD413|nr:Ig-like domain-containing protein [Microlunatus elymi]
MATVLLTTVGLAGCGQLARGENPLGKSDSGSSQQPTSGQTSAAPKSEPSKSTPPPDPFRLTANVADGAGSVKINKVLKVSATHGDLSKVSVTGTVVDHGKTTKVTVDGKLNSSHSGWTASELLEPNGEYTVKMTGDSDQGGSKTFTSQFSSQELSLDQQVYASFAGTMSGTVGVGTPVVLTFDLPVKDKATFEKHLHVSSSSGQKGSWHWYSDKEVHWRPATYWKPGTRVTASADLNSIPAGNGLYGQTDTSTSFTVGSSVVTKVDLKSDIAKVYVNGKVARTIPVSGGGTDTLSTTTRSGTSLITQKETNYRMTSQMIGLPKTGPQSYDLRVKYAMRITNSGEFLHSAPWNAAYFGRENASHGCVGMSNEDAGWLYKTALPGSPVVVTGTSRELEPQNGLTDWNADFATYAEGSAL